MFFIYFLLVYMDFKFNIIKLFFKNIGFIFNMIFKLKIYRFREYIDAFNRQKNVNFIFLQKRK